MEQNRAISVDTLRSYLPDAQSNLPAVIKNGKAESDFSNEREILYKVLFDMKSDLNDLKKLTMELMQSDNTQKVQEEQQNLIKKIYGDENITDYEPDDTEMEVLNLPEQHTEIVSHPSVQEDKYHFAEEIEEEETLSLQDKELELIKKALDRNKGKRKAAASELGISERTLYRKIKQYDL